MSSMSNQFVTLSHVVTTEVRTKPGGGRYKVSCYERKRSKTWGDWTLTHIGVISGGPGEGRVQGRGCTWYSTTEQYTIDIWSWRNSHEVWWSDTNDTKLKDLSTCEGGVWEVQLIFLSIITDKTKTKGRVSGRKTKGVGVMRDKELKLEETEGSHVLGGTGKGLVTLVQGRE